MNVRIDSPVVTPNHQSCLLIARTTSAQTNLIDKVPPKIAEMIN